MDKQRYGIWRRILETALAWLLLVLTWSFPVAGWHRLYLKIPGWYWWAVTGYLSTAGAMLFFVTHQRFWLAGFLPQAVLFGRDCLLIIDRVWRAAR